MPPFFVCDCYYRRRTSVAPAVEKELDAEDPFTMVLRAMVLAGVDNVVDVLSRVMVQPYANFNFPSFYY